MVEITIYHKAHTRTDGSFAHGEHDLESISRMSCYAPRMSRYAPRMSQALKDHIWCRNPTLAKCGGEAQHLEKVRIWSPPGLPNV